MNNLNSVLLEGRLTAEPEISQTPKGTSVCRFSIAVNRYYDTTDGPAKEVSFFDCESWGKLADTFYPQARKGLAVRIVGRLKQDRWVGLDERPKYKIKVIAEHIEFINTNVSETVMASAV
jgi:single-strand DNA-binding protein